MIYYKYFINNLVFNEKFLQFSKDTYACLFKLAILALGTNLIMNIFKAPIFAYIIMNFDDILGCMMTMTTLSERTYIGMVAYLDPLAFTVTLVNCWSEEDFFDLIILKATDIVSYDYYYPEFKEPEPVKKYKRPASKRYRAKIFSK